MLVVCFGQSKYYTQIYIQTLSYDAFQKTGNNRQFNIMSYRTPRRRPPPPKRIDTIYFLSLIIIFIIKLFHYGFVPKTWKLITQPKSKKKKKNSSRRDCFIFKILYYQI